MTTLVITALLAFCMGAFMEIQVRALRPFARDGSALDEFCLWLVPLTNSGMVVICLYGLLG